MLKEYQYFNLQAQYERTPNPSDGFGASGEHYVLFAMLNKFGYYPHSREEAYALTEKLLGEEYEHDN